MNSKVLKNLRPNKEYAELLRNIASKIEVLETSISPEIIEQIKGLSQNAIKLGEEEIVEKEKNKMNFFRTAMKDAIKKYKKETDSSPIKQMLKVNPENRKRLDRLFEAERIRKGESIALLAARGIKKRESNNANRNSDEDIER